MKKLWSVLTDDMDSCIFTGSTDIERHHVFGAYNRKKSEQYGYIAPLRRDLHPNGVFADKKNWKKIDMALKQECQAHYEKHHGSREDFIQEFGRSYL